MSVLNKLMTFLIFSGGAVLLGFGIDRAINKNKEDGFFDGISMYMITLGFILVITSIITGFKKKMNFK